MLSFQLDNLLEANWLQWASIELTYSTSSESGFKEPITSPAGGIQKRNIPDLAFICLEFKQGTNMKQAICGSCGTTATTPTITAPTTNSKY